MTEPATQTAPPGWYPTGDGYVRWWDGRAWTGHKRWSGPTPPANGLAIASLVTGLFGWIPLFSIFALIFGIIGFNRAGGRGGRGKAMSVWGIVLGACWTLAYIYYFAHR